MSNTVNPFDLILQELAEMKETIANIPINQAKQAEIIDRTELLNRLKITEPTLIRMVKRGRIPEIKVGYQCRYNWIEVVRALERS